MSYRTPLARVRHLGSAKNGTHQWWAQRLTAIALVPLTVWFVVNVVTLIGADRPAVVGWLGSPLTAVLMVLMIGATFHHAQLGLQVVIEDYVHREGVKLTLIVLVKFVAFILAVAAIFAVLKIALGG